MEKRTDGGKERMRESSYPGDDDPSGNSRGEDHDENNSRKDRRRKPGTEPQDKEGKVEGNASINRRKQPGEYSLGISGPMNSFIGKKTFGANWNEDLDSMVSIFDTMVDMCQVRR